LCITEALKRNSSCPADRTALSAQDVHRSAYIDRRVGEHRMRCPHAPCDWAGALSELRGHLPRCNFVPAPCGHCGAQLARRDAAAHAAQCSKAPVECEQCGEQVERGALQRHVQNACRNALVACPRDCGADRMRRTALERHLENDCPLQIVACEFAEFGCRERVARNRRAEHVRQSVAEHLLLVAGSARRAEAQAKEMTERVAELQRQREADQRALASVRAELDELRRRPGSAPAAPAPAPAAVAAPAPAAGAWRPPVLSSVSKGSFSLTPQGVLVMRPDLANPSATFPTVCLSAERLTRAAYFELEIAAGGIVQVGWGMAGLAFPGELNGVGDLANSWSYDGSRGILFLEGRGIRVHQHWRIESRVGALARPEGGGVWELTWTVDGRHVHSLRVMGPAQLSPLVSLDSQGGVRLKLSEGEMRHRPAGVHAL
jgi:hypothetical protein